ncbi:MAG: hypothetical protein GQ468_02780 [Candidatus Scalindua sp.]|nr:hypothetical protein [Candidatus Scalindua sp.]
MFNQFLFDVLDFTFQMFGNNYNKFTEIEWWKKEAVKENRKRLNIVDTTYPTISVAELMDDCNRALHAMDVCKTKLKVRKKCGSAKDVNSSTKNWSDLRLFGPYVNLYNVEMPIDKVEIYGHLPHFIINGINTHKYSLKKAKPEDWSIFTFVIIRRMSSLPRDVLPMGEGYAYHVQFVYTWKGAAASMDNFVTIDKEGNVKLCKIYSEGLRQVGKRSDSLSVKTSGYRVYDPMKAEYKDLTTPQLVAGAFNSYAMQSMEMCVRVSDKRGVLNISVPLPMAKKVFSERIKVKTKSGRTKPIFHWVISHMRFSGSIVKTHTRGLRRFVWNKTNIEIYLPGKHRSSLHDMSSLLEGWKNSPFDKLMRKTFGERVKPRKIRNPTTGEKIKVVPVSKAESLEGEYY